MRLGCTVKGPSDRLKTALQPWRKPSSGDVCSSSVNARALHALPRAGTRSGPLASSRPRRYAASPSTGDQHRVYLCRQRERSLTPPPFLRVAMSPSADGALPGARARDDLTAEGWRQFFVSETTPDKQYPVLSLTSIAGHEVRSDATRQVMELCNDDADADAEMDVDGEGDGGGYRSAHIGQERPGTRHAFGGRSVGTGRNTRANLLQGYFRAIATTITKMGVARWLEEFNADRHEGADGALREFLEDTLATPYRGQVWPLESVFGAVARISDADQHQFREPEHMVCWVAPRGDVQCTCRGSTALEAVLDQDAAQVADDDCFHAKLFLDALACDGRLLGDLDAVKTKRFVARATGGDAPVVDAAAPANFLAHAAADAQQPPPPRGRVRGRRSARGGASKKVVAEVEDAEVEVFATGGLPIAVVVAGEGRRRLPAPFKCARKTTSCCYCDTSRKKSCCNVLHTRHLRQRDVMGTTRSSASSKGI